MYARQNAAREVLRNSIAWQRNRIAAEFLLIFVVSLKRPSAKEELWSVHFGAFRQCEFRCPSFVLPFRLSLQLRFTIESLAKLRSNARSIRKLLKSPNHFLSDCSTRRCSVAFMCVCRTHCVFRLAATKLPQTFPASLQPNRP